MNFPRTGTGYDESCPLSKTPVTLYDHTTRLVITANGLANWTKIVHAGDEPIILEMLARMEHTIRECRSMLNSYPDETARKFEKFIEDTL